MSMTQSSSNHGLRSGLSSDFIVLTPPGNNGELDMTSNAFGFSLNMTSLQSSHLSTDDALRRIMDLMKENQELKETVHKSNSSMKQACDTLKRWQESHEEEKHQIEKERQDFNERKEQVRKVVETMEKAIRDRDEHIKELKKQTQLASGERCTASMKEEVSQIQTALKRSSEELVEAQKKCENLAQQVKEFKSKNEELSQEIAVMRDSDNDMKLVVQALKDEKASLDAKFASMNESMQKMRENFDTAMMEKRDLVALNNDLTSQIHQLKGIPGGAAPSAMEVEVQEDLIVLDKPGEPTIEELIKQAARDDPSLGESHFDLTRAADVPSGDSQDVGVRRRGQGQQSMSDLLIQMKEERTKVTEYMTKLTEANAKVEELQKELREKDQAVFEYKGKLDSSMQQGEQDKTEVHKLHSQLHSMQVELQKQQDQRQMAPAEDIQNYRAQVYSLCEELKAAQQNIDALSENKRIVEERCQQLENKCLLYQEEIEKQRSKDDQLIEALRVTITSLEAAIHSEQAKFSQKSAANEDLKKKFDSLVKDYHELLQCNEELQANQGMKGATGMSPQEKKRYDERIDHLTAQIICSEEALKKRDNKIKELLRDNEELTEQVPVLNAQADVFRDDFEAERHAREALVTEKEVLKEEIRQLQVRNQQLQDEVQNMSSYQWGAIRQQQPGGYGQHGYGGGHSPDPRFNYHAAGGLSPQDARTPAMNPAFGSGYSLDQTDELQAPGGNTTPRTPQTPVTPREISTPDEPQYVCPKCSKHFDSMDILQLHVMDCIL